MWFVPKCKKLGPKYMITLRNEIDITRNKPNSQLGNRPNSQLSKVFLFPQRSTPDVLAHARASLTPYTSTSRKYVHVAKASIVTHPEGRGQLRPVKKKEPRGSPGRAHGRSTRARRMAGGAWRGGCCVPALPFSAPLARRVFLP